MQKKKTLKKVYLSKKDRQAASFIGKYIKTKTKKGKEINNTSILSNLSENGFKKYKPTEIRKFIHWLRVHEKYQWILANKNGYFYSEKEEELSEYLASLKRRINAIREVVRSFSVFDKE